MFLLPRAGFGIQQILRKIVVEILKVDLTMHQNTTRFWSKYYLRFSGCRNLRRKLSLAELGSVFFRSGDHGDAVPPLLWPEVKCRLWMFPETARKGFKIVILALKVILLEKTFFLGFQSFWLVFLNLIPPPSISATINFMSF